MSCKKFHRNETFNTTLLESENFRIIPSLGSLVEGWVLLIPKFRINSFCYLGDHYFDELESLHLQTHKILSELYDVNILVFENGSIQRNSSIGCGVDYAHIHYVPINLNVKDILDNEYSDSLNWTEVKKIKEIRSYYYKQTPYFFIQDNFNSKFSTEIPYPKSQLIRKGIAQKLKLADMYDWKKHYFVENIEKTINKFKILYKPSIIKKEIEFNVF